jgi:flagella basal body P-ring formation protein FlgA
MSIFWRTGKSLALSAGIAVALPGGACLAASGSEHQSSASIIAAARQAINEQIEPGRYSNLQVSIKPLDKRLRLAHCDQPLDTHLVQPGTSLGNQVIGVRCEGSKPWKIFVRASVTAEQAMPVLVRALPRNSLIGKDDVVLANFPVPHTGGTYVEKLEYVVGMQLRRDAPANAPIRVNQLETPKVVTRGQRVVVLNQQGGLLIRMTGIAMQDGAEGERIWVKNASSNKQVDGLVNPDGTIQVN